MDDTIDKVQIIRKNEVDSLLNDLNGQKLEHSIFLELSLKAYKLIDGRVLVIRDGATDCPLYPSEKVLLRQLLNHDNSKVVEILAGVNIYGKEFSSKAEELSKTFLNKLNIDLANKTSIEIINAVDEYIVVNRNALFFKENFLTLIALLGTLINNEYGTKWIMRESNNVWNPYLSYNGKTIFLLIIF